jgi:anti-sigma factor RsiW
VPLPPCSRVVALLSDYLENRLPAGVRQDLERHLGGCDACTSTLDTFRTTVSLLKSLSEEDLPEELRLRLRSFLDTRCDN